MIELISKNKIQFYIGKYDFTKENTIYREKYENAEKNMHFMIVL